MNIPSTFHLLRRTVRPASGFTLVELLIVIAIFAILAGSAAPSLSALVNSVRLNTIASDFLTALNLTRSEAIRRNEKMTLCKSSDGRSCSRQGGWEQGWLAFHDADKDGVVDEAERVFLRAGALPAGLVFSGNLQVAHQIHYMPSGETRTAGGGFQAGTLTLCRVSGSSAQVREVVINATGRPRLQKGQAASCGV